MKRVAFGRRQAERLLQQVRIDHVNGVVVLDGAVRIEMAAHDADHVNEAVAVLEGVEIARHDDAAIRIRGLARSGGSWRSRAPVRAASGARDWRRRGALDAAQRAAVNADHRERERCAVGDVFSFQHEWRPIVEQAAIEAERGVLADLRHRRR